MLLTTYHHLWSWLLVHYTCHSSPANTQCCGPYSESMPVACANKYTLILTDKYILGGEIISFLVHIICSYPTNYPAYI